MMERKHVQSSDLTFALLVPTAIGLLPYWELSDLALSVLSYFLALETRSRSRIFGDQTDPPPHFPSLLGELVDRSGHGAAGVVSSWLVCPSGY